MAWDAMRYPGSRWQRRFIKSQPIEADEASEKFSYTRLTPVSIQRQSQESRSQIQVPRRGLA